MLEVRFAVNRRIFSFLFPRVLCALAAVFSVVGTVAPAWAQFETRASHTLPGEAFSIAAGDFNGDGKLDIAIMDGQLSVLLGNGDGTFQSPVNYQGTIGFSVAVGDFNGDGKLDLVTANGYNSVSVYLGNGDGTFQSPKTTTTTDDCSFVAVGDFNGDHKLDVVVIDSPYISVLLGNGDGTFEAPIDNNSFVGAHELAVGDFNNDHRLDVAVVGYFGGSHDIGIFLGNGDGTLQPSLTHPLTYTPGSVAAADFNHDGNLDVAVGGLGAGVAILLGKGDGTFQPEVDYPTTGGGGALSTSDFSGDSKLDLAFSAAIPPGVNELLGNGNGTFQPAQFFSAGRFAGALAIGDFNADHKPDIVYLDRNTGAITLLNTGPLSFSPSTPLGFPAAQLVNTTSAPEVVTLTNSGATAVSIQSIAASGQFQTSDTCAGEIAAGASCTISAVFGPKTAGPHRGLITLRDSASSKPQIIELSGRGTFLALSPNPLSFPPQKVGTKSSPQQLSITNDGSTSLILSSVTVGGANAKDFTLSGTGNCTNQELARGATCKVTVTFSPKKTGVRSATIFVYDNGAGSPETATATGTGT
jgi:FG-GAP-like repeat/FG-GAP repeat